MPCILILIERRVLGYFVSGVSTKPLNRVLEMSSFFSFVLILFLRSYGLFENTIFFHTVHNENGQPILLQCAKTH